MRVLVNAENKRRVNLALPTRLIINRPLAGILAGLIRKQTGIKISTAQARLFVRALNEAKRDMRRSGIPLVEVHSDDGTEVLIKL